MDVIPWATWKLYVYQLLKKFLPEELLMLYKLFFKIFTFENENLLATKALF